MAKILIVDDEERILKLYSTVLRKAGYQVLTASDAKKGLDLAVSAQPDLIFLDVMMPIVDGPEAQVNLSENASTRHIPVIFLTSLLKQGEAEDTRAEIGGHEFISKSTPNAVIVARVKEILAAAPPRPHPGVPV